MSSKISLSTTHNTWINTLKVLSTFLVITNHSISHVWTNHAINTPTWKIIHFFILFSRISIPLFFMCSGAGMLRKENSFKKIFTHNIFNILRIYVAWMLIYGIIECISLFQRDIATFRICFNELIKCILFGHYHTWFILTLLGLYLITPFLFQITRTKENIVYFLLVSFIFTIILPWLQTISYFSRLTDTLNNFNMYFVYGYVLYYVMGYYLYTIPKKKTYAYFSTIVLILSLGFAYIYSMKLSISSGTPYQECFMEFTPLMFFASTSLFYIFKDKENIFLSRLIKTLIGYGFGLYLMHPLLLKYVQQLFGLYAFAGTFLLYTSCVMICFFFSKNKILSKLFLK